MTNGAQTDKKEIEKQIEACYTQSADYSGHLSSILRQLAIAEGALFWFSKIHFRSPDILLILGFVTLIIYFMLDSIQYLIGLIQYERLAKTFHRDYKINKIYDINKYEMDPPEYIDLFFYLKIIAIIVASVMLIYSFINVYLCSGAYNVPLPV